MQEQQSLSEPALHFNSYSNSKAAYTPYECFTYDNFDIYIKFKNSYRVNGQPNFSNEIPTLISRSFEILV